MKSLRDAICDYNTAKNNMKAARVELARLAVELGMSQADALSDHNAYWYVKGHLSKDVSNG